jgi:hypothetical protein
MFGEILERLLENREGKTVLATRFRYAAPELLGV